MLRSRIGARTVACAAVCIALTLVGCANEERPLLLPSPGESRAVVRLGPGRLAVLAGPATARGIFIIDDRDGHVLKSFGVTGTATDLAAGSVEGPLFLAVGADDGRKSVGAVETWSLDGVKTHVEPLPGAALAISTQAAGKSYALVRIGKTRSVVPLAANGRAGTPMAADADVASIVGCTIGGAAYLALGADHGKNVALLDLQTGRTRRSDVASSVVACGAAYGSVYALERSGDGAALSLLTIPKLRHGGLLDVGASVRALFGSDDELLALESSEKGGSTIVRYPRSVLERAAGLGSAL